MRIGINARFLIKDKLEGLGVYSHEILSRLVKAMPEHEFIFFFDRKWDDSFIYGKNVFPVNLFPPARHPLLWYWWFEKSLPAALKKYKTDLFFSPDGYLSLKSSVPQLLTIHDLAFEHYPEHVPGLVGQYYRKFTPLYCRKAAQIAAVSAFTKNDIMQQYHIPENKISVVYNGCSEVFQPISSAAKQTVRNQISDGKPYFIYIGAIHPRKNIANLLRAFALFREKNGEDIRLVLAGRMAWQNDEVKDLLKTESLSKAVHYKTHVSREDVAAFTAGAQAMLYPSYFEGFGLPVLEAMRCGVPAITTEGSPMQEFAKDACMAVQPDDVEQMAQAMQYLVSHPSEYSIMAEKGMHYAEEYTWDNAAKKIQGIILQMISELKKN